MTTRVLNLETGQTQLYTLPARKAVVCAYEQDKGNHNTWMYNYETHSLLQAGPSGRTVFCDKFAAML